MLREHSAYTPSPAWGMLGWGVMSPEKLMYETLILVMS